MVYSIVAWKNTERSELIGCGILFQKGRWVPGFFFKEQYCFLPRNTGGLICLFFSGKRKGGVIFCFTLKFVHSDFFSYLVSEKRKKGGVRAFLEVRYFLYGVMYVGKSFNECNSGLLNFSSGHPWRRLGWAEISGIKIYVKNLKRIMVRDGMCGVSVDA